MSSLTLRPSPQKNYRSAFVDTDAVDTVEFFSAAQSQTSSTRNYSTQWSCRSVADVFSTELFGVVLVSYADWRQWHRIFESGVCLLRSDGAVFLWILFGYLRVGDDWSCFGEYGRVPTNVVVFLVLCWDSDSNSKLVLEMCGL